VNRALRAATVGVLLLSPVALSACSAGQVTQTATQERDKVGAMAHVGDITVRAAELEHPRGGAYESGDDAELRLVIVNGGQEADTLVGIDGEGFGGVEFEVAGTGTSSPAATGTAPAPGTTPAPGTAPATGSGSASADEIEIPADTTLFVDGDAATITLTGLDESLTVGQYLELILTFENAGEVTLPVTVANPDETLERGEAFDFHQEEGTEEHNEGEQREGGE
jgi:copper(I)-binding protein